MSNLLKRGDDLKNCNPSFFTGFSNCPFSEWLVYRHPSFFSLAVFLREDDSPVKKPSFVFKLAEYFIEVNLTLELA